jgi:hypothetical protein
MRNNDKSFMRFQVFQELETEAKTDQGAGGDVFVEAAVRSHINMACAR